MSQSESSPGSSFPGSSILDLDAALAVAKEAARAAGAVQKAHLSSLGNVRHKGGNAKDVVTEVDDECERLIREMILGAFPTHTILGEEGGSVAGSDPRYRWVVDPLDGTVNYAHGFPFFCVSIALEAEGEIVVGVVYGPMQDELFTAVKDQGATLNGQPIHVSGASDLRESLLTTGFPYDPSLFHRAMVAFEALNLQSRAVRRAGSAALDLCYVACGRFEGYWELVIMPWDVAAGVLIITESGGTVTRPDQTAFSIECGDVLATNGLIHSRLALALAAAEGI